MGLGAFGVVLIMALSPIASAGVATNLALKHATPQDFSDQELYGCASLSHATAKLSLHTGLGKYSASAKAASCSKAKHVSQSIADDYNELGAAIPVALKSTNTGVSLGLSIHAIATDSAVIKGSTSKCPLNYYNYTYWNGTTWYNFSEVYGDCYVEAGFYLSSYAYLIDTTTNVYIYGTSTGISNWNNQSGAYFDTFGYTYTYSNPLYWSHNYTYGPSTTNSSYGSGGSMTISSTPTYYFNSTFNSSNKYVLEFYFDNEVFAEQYVFKGTCSAAVDASTGVYHEDISSLRMY